MINRLNSQIQIGSFEKTVSVGENLLEAIFEDIKTKENRELTNKVLHHITAYSMDDNFILEVNGYDFETKDCVFSTPYDTYPSADYLIIDSLIAKSAGLIQIYYIR